ncbi:Zinc finger, PHD-type [Gossypium australe]|uniref:Zinc finger, PHD-type n=1 Tax=Gossypium australe TaxID=47621 RepID=A0A5B6VIP4_9ROSI|nr:Zinc finger, PHD-type [Gossypium australe]
MSKKIQHFLHRHLLWLLWVSQDDQLGCRGCCKRITGSIYILYRASQRNLKFLSLMPSSPYHLDYEHTCNACFKIGSSLSNCCKRCEFDLHVASTQWATIETEELIQHFTH